MGPDNTGRYFVENSSLCQRLKYQDFAAASPLESSAPNNANPYIEAIRGIELGECTRPQVWNFGAFHSRETMKEYWRLSFPDAEEDTTAAKEPQASDETHEGEYGGGPQQGSEEVVATFTGIGLQNCQQLI